LQSKLEDIRAEGLENRYARHARLNEDRPRLGPDQRLQALPGRGYGSLSLNCFANTRNIDLAALNKILKTKHGLVIDGGYGKLKGKTFRISNMGDETDATIAELIKALDSAWPRRRCDAADGYLPIRVNRRNAKVGAQVKPRCSLSARGRAH
jgi:aspartate aminotransferase-like enzyme